VYSAKFIFAAMYLRRVGIESRSYAAAPTQVSTVVTPPAPAAQNLGVKKGWGGCGDAAAAGDKQLGRCAAGKMKYMALWVSGKLILPAMYLKQVEIDGRTYAAAPTQVSTVVTPPAPAAHHLGAGRRRPCSAGIRRNRVNINGFISTVVSYSSQRWHGPHCAFNTKPRRGFPGYRTGPPACAQSRAKIRMDSTRGQIQNKSDGCSWLSLAVPGGGGAVTRSHKFRFSSAAISSESPCSARLL
jgi:hypothetical protein